MRISLVVFLFSALLLQGCSPSDGTQDTDAIESHVFPQSNVILICFDTLRADHLGCYGYEKSTSPNIDLFSKHSTLFNTAISQAPSTKASHASLFTSLYVTHHGTSGFHSMFSEDNLTLAEVLKNAGYQTVSFNGNGRISSQYGFDQGFDIYSESSNDRFMDVVDKALNWLDGNAHQKFFLFLHTYEVHLPYQPNSRILELFDSEYGGSLPNRIKSDLIKKINAGEMEIDDDDIAHIVNLYDASIRSVDTAFSKLINELIARGIYDDSMIIVFSDHGEEFGEHGMMATHSHTLYEEIVRVPLIIKFPKNAFKAMRVEGPVSLIDILPTIHEVLDIPTPDHYDGVSLVKQVMNDDKMGRICISERSGRNTDSIRTGKWKLYGDALYDLSTDPSETKDVSQSNLKIKERLRLLLDKKIDKSKCVVSEEAELDKETLDRLRELGYID